MWQTITLSSLPLILAKLVELFNNLRVLLLVLFNGFLGLFILHDFEKSINRINLYSSEVKCNQLNDGFYYEIDFEMYQKMEPLEKFLYQYTFYLLDAYRKIWDTFLTGCFLIG